ncbi:MAG: biopolymer transporter ExbD [Candidatus Omnitrophica bacterium]|nr:biopolymer transporter ExbD [Candidatus Omnitrophota bacterium]
MRFKRHIELEHGLRQIDIAPLIDMVFQLLIFFMLTSSFIIPSGIRINLPRALSSEVLKEKNIEIAISSENIVYLNGKVVNLAELKEFLKDIALKEDISIFIKADRRAFLGRVVEIWDLCRQLGILHINIATTQ